MAGRPYALLALLLAIALLANLHFRPYAWYTVVAIAALSFSIAVLLAAALRQR
jgi:uncharacterized membrane protein YoaK (UPF0700 family)